MDSEAITFLILGGSLTMFLVTYLALVRWSDIEVDIKARKEKRKDCCCGK